MQILKEWPVLQAEARTGRAKFWQVRALREGSDGFVQVEWWQRDSLHQTAERRAVGKNTGRANATTSIEQAVLEAESEFKKQQDKGYWMVGLEKEAAYELPMLAHDFAKRGHAIEFDCFGQPKLDGFRTLHDPERGFWSRQGKRFDEAVDLSHLRLEPYYEKATFDGELILPQGYTFQQTCQAIKKQRFETGLLQYWIFDVILDAPFSERFKYLESLASTFPPRVHLVPTLDVESVEVAQEMLSIFTGDGYEGLILRNKEGRYEVGQRSADLQKFKTFRQEEFLVVDLAQGVGREEGAAILVCETAEGTRFSARPRGTYEMRQRMFREKEKHVNSMWTIRFQGMTTSELAVPRFPVGIAPREGWDL